MKKNMRRGWKCMRAILIDDEQHALTFLERQLHKHSQIEVIAKYCYFDIKINKDILNEINIVFLDIDMPNINGLELAEQLLEINPDLFIVFVTAFNEYAVQAFELNALDYILKPVDQKRLKKTLNRISERRQNNAISEPIAEDHLQINMFQQLSFQTSNATKLIKWRTKKAQEIFAYLLHNVNQTVRKSHLAELFWPNFQEERAYSQLYTAIYHIRKVLTKYKAYLTIKNIHEGYMLAIDHTTIDVVDWESALNSAPTLTMNTIDEYEQIMKLYTGAYLAVHEYFWAEAERYRLELLWLDAARAMADLYWQHNDVDKAIQWYENICQSIPEDEKANFMLMKIYDMLGYGLLVNHQYQQFRHTLQDLNIEMNSEIQAWYESRNAIN